MAAFGTGTCRVCGDEFVLTMLGHIRAHTDRGLLDAEHRRQTCLGSGRPAQEHNGLQAPTAPKHPAAPPDSPTLF